MSVNPLPITSVDLIALVDRSLAAPPGQSLIIVVLASISEETGLPWCSDCTQASDAIGGVIKLASEGAASIAVCNLSRHEWKSEEGQSNHPLRLHPQLMVGGIPFVARIVDGKIIGRATEEECFNVDDLAQRLKLKS
jgi:hypothetical protein